MAVIQIAEGREWFVARWAYRWLMESAMAECGEDSSCRSLFEQSLALDGLHLEMLESEQIAKIRKVLSRVAQAAANGEAPPVEVEGRVLDDRSQKEYRSAAGNLVKLLDTLTDVDG